MTAKTKKIILGVIAGIILLIAIAAVAAPRDFHVERSVVINKPRYDTYTYLKSLANGNQWSPWTKLDPAMSTDFKGAPDGTVGAILAWSGNKDVGSGEQEITNLVDGDRIDYELRFTEPMKSTAKSYIITKGVENNQTQVIWVMDSENKFPYNVMCWIFGGEKMVAEQFDQGLANLKDILE